MNVEAFAIALGDPLDTAAGRIDHRRGFLVRCTHRDAAGVGEATPLPGWTESHDACAAALSDAVERAAEAGISAARRELPASAVAARHGVATALLDADARAEGVSLAAWLDGNAPADSVPVNATLGDGDGAVVAATAREAVDAGFHCLKLKVGARSVEEDLERVGAVRRAVGDAPELRVDANGAWSRSEAEAAIEGLADRGVRTLEQPLPAADLAGHAELRGGPVEVALDEALVAHDAASVLAAEAADVLVVKPMVLGGPGEAYAVAHRCRETGVDPVLSTTIDAVVARTAAVHVAATIPDVRASGLATADRLVSDLSPDPAPVADGRVAVPDGPGLGLGEVRTDG